MLHTILSTPKFLRIAPAVDNIEMAGSSMLRKLTLRFLNAQNETQNYSSSDNSSTDNTPYIIGLVIGSILLACLCGLLGYVIYHHKSSQRSVQPISSTTSVVNIHEKSTSHSNHKKKHLTSRFPSTPAGDKQKEEYQKKPLPVFSPSTAVVIAEAKTKTPMSSILRRLSLRREPSFVTHELLPATGRPLIMNGEVIDNSVSNPRLSTEKREEMKSSATDSSTAAVAASTAAPNSSITPFSDTEAAAVVTGEVTSTNTTSFKEPVFQARSYGWGASPPVAADPLAPMSFSQVPSSSSAYYNNTPSSSLASGAFDIMAPINYNQNSNGWGSKSPAIAASTTTTITTSTIATTTATMLSSSVPQNNGTLLSSSPSPNLATPAVAPNVTTSNKNTVNTGLPVEATGSSQQIEVAAVKAEALKSHLFSSSVTTSVVSPTITTNTYIEPMKTTISPSSSYVPSPAVLDPLAPLVLTKPTPSWTNSTTSAINTSTAPAFDIMSPINFSNSVNRYSNNISSGWSSSTDTSTNIDTTTTTTSTITTTTTIIPTTTAAIANITNSSVIPPKSTSVIIPELSMSTAVKTTPVSTTVTSNSTSSTAPISPRPFHLLPTITETSVHQTPSSSPINNKSNKPSISANTINNSSAPITSVAISPALSLTEIRNVDGTGVVATAVTSTEGTTSGTGAGDTTGRSIMSTGRRLDGEVNDLWAQLQSVEQELVVVRARSNSVVITQLPPSPTRP